ncbi:MAG: hypothetical protein HMLKMBBP_03792 [Planctomycetes bacterium]|nr:hypothetical protein [Planctomycetota bacterium]
MASRSTFQASIAPLGRRALLRRAASTAGVAALSGGVSLSGILSPVRSAHAGTGRRFLVLLRLYGGNDGLNTTIPFTQGTYRDLRPTLAVPEGDELPFTSTLGFHPSMAKLKAHFDAGRVAVIQQVGYAPASLSHFRSEIIWQSADPVDLTATGWIGRYLDTLAPAGDPEVRGVNVSWGLDHVFNAAHANVLVSPRIENFFFPTDYFGVQEDNDQKRALFERLSQEPRAPGSFAAAMAASGYVLSRNVDLYRAIPDLASSVQFPDTDLAQSFRTVARMIASGCADATQSGVFQIGYGSFDTHSDQDADGGHADQWAEICDALDAFQQEAAAQGVADDVIVVTYSEFGRRVEENGSRGTDHGTAAPMFVIGSSVSGGVYGADPDLAHLDPDGNMVHETDFRQVYATVLERWLGADAQEILGGPFAQIPFLGT